MDVIFDALLTERPFVPARIASDKGSGIVS